MVGAGVRGRSPLKKSDIRQLIGVFHTFLDDNSLSQSRGIPVCIHVLRIEKPVNLPAHDAIFGFWKEIPTWCEALQTHPHKKETHLANVNTSWISNNNSVVFKGQSRVQSRWSKENTLSVQSKCFRLHPKSYWTESQKNSLMNWFLRWRSTGKVYEGTELRFQ